MALRVSYLAWIYLPSVLTNFLVRKCMNSWSCTILGLIWSGLENFSWIVMFFADHVSTFQVKLRRDSLKSDSSSLSLLT